MHYATIALIVISVIVLIGLIVLQVVLSLMKNKRLGLIIPIIFLVLALILTLTGFIFYMTESTVQIVIIGHLILFTPFFINLIIYFICRGIVKEKQKTSSEIDVMKIKDL